jgi:hypothetical protein
MDANICYKVSVPTVADYGKKDEMIGVRVSSSVKDRLERIMAEHDRTMSWVANALLVRGLGLFERDGKFKDSELLEDPAVRVVHVRSEGELTDEVQTRNAGAKTPTGSRRKLKAAK